MSVPDIGMPAFSRLVTRWLPEEVELFERGISSGQVHPRDAKMVLAHEIVACFFNENAAQQAQATFVRTYQQHAAPAEMPVYTVQPGQSILDILVNTKLASSRGQARRLLDQNGVRLDGAVVVLEQEAFTRKGVLQAGKRHFVRLE